MAKSIRSKRKRMLRNIKRERYAKKELEKLKQVVALAEKDKDADMKDLYTGKTTTINDIASFIEIQDCTLYLLTVLVSWLQDVYIGINIALSFRSPFVVSVVINAYTCIYIKFEIYFQSQTPLEAPTNQLMNLQVK